MSTIWNTFWKRGCRKRPGPGSPSCYSSGRLQVEELEGRALLSHTPIPLQLQQGQASVTAAPTLEAQCYTLTVTESGRLTALVDASVGETRLTLKSDTGRLLLQSDGQSPTNLDDWMDLHLVGSPGGTTYHLEVQPVGGNAAGYTLTATFTPATPPFIDPPTGLESWGLDRADLNQDGILDLVSANFATDDVSVLIGVGDGTFRPEVRYATGAGPNDVLLVDLNGDSIRDLITADFEAGTLSIRHGQGDGSFGTRTALAVGSAPAALVGGHFNSDARMDLAFVDYATSELVVLLQQDLSTFAPPVRFGVGASPYDLTLGDFNGDQILDVATVDYTSNTVTVLQGDGAGAFAVVSILAVGETPYAIQAADLDADGKQDLVTANTNGGTVNILYGRGDGTFETARTMQAGLGPTGLTIADINEDGRQDLLVTNLYDSTLWVALGDRHRMFRPQVPTRVMSSPLALVAGDFNGDQHIDLGYGNYGTSSVTVALGHGDGTFARTLPAQSGGGVDAVSSGDFNNDGRRDLVVVSYARGDALILLGRADGTFRAYSRIRNGSDPVSVAVGDFDQDGNDDVVLGNYSTQDISLSLGRGDGTFDAPEFVEVGSVPGELLAGDFDGNGTLDLATANQGSDDVTLLLGDGAGGWVNERTLQVGDTPLAIVSGHFNEDAHLDLATANAHDGTVSVLFGQGGGDFAAAIVLQVGAQPTGLATGDLDGDGLEDLAVVNNGDSSLTLLLSRPQTPEGFVASTLTQVGDGSHKLAVGHFNLDSQLDLAVIQRDGNSLTLLFGAGDGTFTLGPERQVGSRPECVLSDDFNGDTRPDLAIANFGTTDISILLQQANGVFGGDKRTPAGMGPVDIAQSDFNSDGFQDLVAAGFHEDRVYVVLGAGDTTTDPFGVLPTQDGPSAVAAGDLNRDGRPDVLIAEQFNNTVSIRLGQGNGSFGPSVSFSVGHQPTDIVAVDLNRDDLLDLVTSNFGSGDVSVLHGRGDGTFGAARHFTAGEGAATLAVADLNGDGILDLLSGNELVHSVAILLGTPQGDYLSPLVVVLPSGPQSLAVLDVDHDGRLDIAAASQPGDAVYLIANRPGGFELSTSLAVAGAPIAMAAGDVNADGNTDLVIARHNANSLSVLLGQANGSFLEGPTVRTGEYPTALLLPDANNDGRLDVLTINAMGKPGSVSLGRGDGTFTHPSPVGYPIQHVPQVGDLDQDGIQDVAILQQSGAILVRMGQAGGTFAPPLTVNPQAGWRARDLTLATVNGSQHLVAVNASDNSVSLYCWDCSTRAFVRSSTLPVGAAMPVFVVADDLNADGRDDLAVATASGRLRVFHQSALGTFGTHAHEVSIGTAPAALGLLRLPGSDRPSLAVLDAVSGVVRVFVNSTAQPFATELRYRTGTSLTGMDTSHAGQFLRSVDTPVALVSGGFDGDGVEDLIVVNRDANHLALLRGTASGGLLNASTPQDLMTGTQPVSIVAGDFDGDGNRDLAVLNQAQQNLSIFLGDGLGEFHEPLHGGPHSHAHQVSAGSAPSGLTAHDVNGDGRLDLLVGNRSGDVLTLLGNGDGSFQPYQRLGRGKILAVADLNGDGRDDFIFANQKQDRVAAEYSTPGQTFALERTDGILDPEQVEVADLDGDGRRDLVIVNSGGNNVLIYRGMANGQFAPARSFFAGTSPSGLTIRDLNGDGQLDLVIANEGSNDVSVLLGQGQGQQWTLLPGPRLRAGAGPVAVTVHDVTDDGRADLLVSNGRSNDVFVLPGVGGGFFDDRTPMVFGVGQHPGGIHVGHFDSRPGLDLVTINFGSGDLSFYSGLRSEQRITIGGINPVAFLTGDFNTDGLEDLVVLSQQDNRVALLMGSADGLQLLSVLSPAGLSRPSDIELASLGQGTFDVYVTTEGSDEVSRLTFVLDLAPVLPGQTLPTRPGQQLADIASLGGAAIEAVTVLLLAPVDVVADPEANILDSPVAESLELEVARPPSGSRAAQEEEGQPEEHRDALSDSITSAEPTEAEIQRNSFVLGVEGLPFERGLVERALAPEVPQEWQDLPFLEGLFDPLTDPELLDEAFRQLGNPTSQPTAPQGGAAVEELTPVLLERWQQVAILGAAPWLIAPRARARSRHERSTRRSRPSQE